MELKIFFRQRQHYNAQQQPVLYKARQANATSPYDLELVTGTVARGTWKEMTHAVAGLEKLRLTWTNERDDEGAPALNGAFQETKSVSGMLTVSGDAYQFLKEWCEDHVAARLNEVEVRLQDSSCGEYWGWTVGSQDIEHCENGECLYTVYLKQREDPFHCIQKTVISDNWQGWFQEKPANGKRHPRFNYCNEIRPNGTLIVTWYLLGFLAAVVLTTLGSIVIMTGNIGGIFTWLFGKLKGLGIKVPNWVKAFAPPGSDDFEKMKQQLRVMYLEAAGCGRVHPAPLIRDYISNVCDRCGVKVDEYTAPIFFSKVLKSPSGDFIETSSGRKSGDNPHYYACYFNAPAKKGIRLFSGVGNVLDPKIVEDTTTFYIDGNSPLIALSDFLHHLKTLYNAEWRIKYVKGEPYLYFWRKDWFYNTTPIYDFSIGAAGRDKILEGVCFEWDEVSYPASMIGLYAQDAIDSCGNEARTQMGGNINFGDAENNKLLSGVLNKETPYFGATRFRLDGANTDYLYDAMQQLLNSQFLQSATDPQMRYVNDWIRDHVNYGLLLKDDTSTLPKVLIWDPNTGYQNAKCIMNKVPMSTALKGVRTLPKPNLRYNTGNIQWKDRYPPKTHVKGNAISFAKPSDGIYDVLSYVGKFTSTEARLVNYPMYFEPFYEDTMWDWFHWIDDPRSNPRVGKTWTVKIDLCCDDLKKLKVIKPFDYISNPTIPQIQKETQDNAIGDVVKLPLKQQRNGLISEIEVVYDPTDTLGRHIKLKGTV